MKKNKNFLILVSAVLLTVGFAFATAFYRTEFIKWKNIPLTYICFALSVIFTGLTALVLSNNHKKFSGNHKKQAVLAVVSAAAMGISSFLCTVIINNVIGHGLLAVKAINTAMAIMTSVFFLMLIILSEKKPLRIVSAFLAVVMILAIVFGNSVLEDRRLKARIQTPAEKAVENWGQNNIIGKDADFYVSADGNDDNDGSYEHPFATIEKAAEAVRNTDRTGKDKIVVGVFPGEYRTKGISFTEEDSGAKECPVVYGVCDEGECIINAGVSLSTEDFKHITDENVLSRLTEEAQSNVLCLNLADYGISSDDYGKIYTIGSYNTAAQYTGDYVGPLYSELFVNDKRMTLARYPNEGYLETEKVISTGYGLETNGSLTKREDFYETVNPESDVYKISKKLTDRISSWQTLDDVWMFGFWKYDWADASSPIGKFDAKSRTLSPKFVSTYGTKEGAPYYFFNVFEELDTAGEWYLDRENSLLYVYPDENFEESTVDMSLGLSEIIKCENTSYLTFDGFTFKGTRGDAVSVSGNSNTISNCIIKNVAGNAINIIGYDNTVTGCEITRTGKGGIILDGGDRETLKAGNNKAENNFIHDWSEIYQTYQPAVTLNGVGNICSHNEMYHSPHEAIMYGGNDHIIEYNLIHDVCLLTDDGGIIYSGRRWDNYGTVIRYNCLYNPGSGDHRPNGIYLDDALSGQTAYGNILINIPQIGFHLGGGRDLTIKNNILVNCPDRAFSYDDRAIEGVFGGWFLHSSEKDGDMWTNLYDSPYGSEIWNKAYPQMTKFKDDFDNTDDPDFVPNPSYSDISGNVIIGGDGSIGFISDSAYKYSTIENNPIYEKDALNDIFTDYENGDYSLKENSIIFDTLPDFEEIPLESIGRYNPD